MTSKIISVNHVAVAGGGIGGLCTAIALTQAGCTVSVYERAPALGRVGAGLTLWSNAIKALRHLGVADAVIAAGTVIESGGLLDWRGQQLAALSQGASTTLFGAPTVAIHRADLHHVLLQALPDGVLQLAAGIAGCSQDPNGVTVSLEDGRSVRADLLVGADGLHSVIRRQLFPKVQPRYSGYTAWRGVADLSDLRLWGAAATESWGSGQRFGLLRVNQDQVYWFATANTPASVDQPQPERKPDLLHRFAGWHDPISRVLELTPDDATLRNDIFDLPPFRPWYEGRVVLLGDAAHATTPNMGQGAGQAIESSVVLARCLARHETVPAALRAYEAERFPRTSWITRQSWQIGRVGQWENRLVTRLRNGLVRLTPPAVTIRQIKRAAAYEV